MGIAIAAFGLQIISTNVYAYVTNCYKPQLSEISIPLNFGRQTFSFTLGFYMIPFAEETTFGTAPGGICDYSCVGVPASCGVDVKGTEMEGEVGDAGFP